VMGGGGEGIRHHLASQAELTDRIRCRGRGDLETSDQVLFDHPPENRVVARLVVPQPMTMGCHMRGCSCVCIPQSISRGIQRGGEGTTCRGGRGRVALGLELTHKTS